MTRFSLSPRGLVATVAVALLALTSSACNKGAAPAATINGTELGTSRVLAGARLWGKLPVDASIASLTPDAAKVPAALITSYLNNLISWQAVHAVAVEQGVVVTRAQQDEAGTRLSQELTTAKSKTSWKQLPTWFQDQLTRYIVELAGLQKKLAKGDDGTALAKKTYEASKASYATYCVDALVTVKKPDAAAALAQIRGGATFSAVARATAKKAGGQAGGAKRDGDLGCATLSSFQSSYNFDANLLTDIQASADGDLLGPISYQGAGYLVVRLRSRKVPTFAEVKAQIIAAQPPAGQAETSKAVAAYLQKAKVEINPRFGTWSSTGVVAPKGADPAATATTPTVAPAPAN